ncbi:MAG: D-glycero-beta-D-manno-heptose 1-phosphate adenylyltransferase [Candidatus Cloacimonetes bacterium]|nr:D-glycero-beta-D-manno-heptose 1-phosphate adenylyltransferase [Candidatus Cloacimonadota bacterium]
MNSKVRSWSEIKEIVDLHRKNSQKIVFTNGCFDILHAGHIHYLVAARQLGDILLLGLNSDSSVRRLKGTDRPINNQTDRATVLSHIDIIDYLVIFEEDTPYNLINHIKPDILVKGGDWPVEKIVGADIVLSCGGQVRSLPYLTGYSTTEIMHRMKNGK